MLNVLLRDYVKNFDGIGVACDGMRAWKQQLIRAGFAVVGATRLHKALAPLTCGQGAILMFHHVRPWAASAFAPNRLLEIEPSFLDSALTRIRVLGFDIVSMDEALSRLPTRQARPFVVLTFDDGYADVVTHALPILEKHGAPFTLYITTGFADRTARLWWVELEAAIRALRRVDVTIDGCVTLLTATDEDKTEAFRQLYWRLRNGPEERLLSVTALLMAEAGLSSQILVESLCLDWRGIQALAMHPLCTIGVHTLSHPMLAKHDDVFVRHELAESRRLIEMRTGLPARHLAYPVGDVGSAGPRDYAIAAEMGFSSAVTTRPGMLFPGHEHHTTALPRLSVNGNWQSLESFEMLLSGVPFALWNKGRRIAV